MTDVGVSALGHGCGRLQVINLRDCNLVTDVGVSALGHGCGQLQHIYLGDCLVTDVGVSAWVMDMVSCSTSILQVAVW